MKMILSLIMFGATILVIFGAIFQSSIFRSLNVFAIVTLAIAMLIMNHYEEKERRKNICQKTGIQGMYNNGVKK